MAKTNFKKINYLNFPLDYKKRGSLYLTAIKRVLSSGTYTLSHEVENFENSFAKYLGVKYCVGVANGLEALQISLMACGVGKGDEVITTPISAVATTLAIMAVGATPIFADTDGNGQIDVNLLQKAITGKTKAVLPVDLYGQPCEMDKIRFICNKHNLILIEDASQAHGSTYKNKKLGTYGHIGCFSFYPTKNLGAFGDGGAIVTNDLKLATKFRQIRDYGQESKYRHTVYGLNSRLDELHAAVLSVKLKLLDKDNGLRRKIAARYIKNLSQLNQIEIVLPKNINDSNFHLVVIKTEKRDELQSFLKDKGIPTLVHYPLTIPQQPVIKNMGIKTGKLPVSENFVNKILSLPCHPHMSINEVDYVCGKIVEYFSSQ